MIANTLAMPMWIAGLNHKCSFPFPLQLFPWLSQKIGESAIFNLLTVKIYQKFKHEFNFHVATWRKTHAFKHEFKFHNENDSYTNKS